MPFRKQSARCSRNNHQANLRLLYSLGLVIAFACVIFVLSCWMFLPSSSAKPVSTYTVTTTDDSGSGSLRDAITQANASPSDDTIDFNLSGCMVATPCTIALTTGELAIANNGQLNITGPGADVLRISGSNQSRVFNIASTAVVNISGVTVTGGRTANGSNGAPNGSGTGGNGGKGDDGGGIYNSGALTLTNCTISGNNTGDGGFAGNGLFGGFGGKGGNGGGIYNNSGTLNLVNSIVSVNNTGNGNLGGSTSNGTGGAGGSGGGGGKGGGVYHSGGMLSITNSIISGNNTGNGGLGGSACNGCIGGTGGAGGDGAGLYINSGSISILNSKINGNHGGRSGDGGTAGTSGGSDLGGSGAGVFHNSGTLDITDSTFDSNIAGNAGNSSQGFFSVSGGIGGFGGGIFNRGTLNLERSTVSNNAGGTGGTGSQNQNTGGHGGTGGVGGGIYNENSGTLNLINSTISINRAGNGGTGGSCFGSGSCSGRIGGAGGGGGGIESAGTLNITNVTVSNNSTGQRGTGADGPGPAGTGGGIERTNGTVKLRNSIVANNILSNPGFGPDVHGSFTSLGHNFIGTFDPTTSSGFTNDPTCAGLCDQVGTLASPKDPLLGPLQDNGGPTFTRNLQLTSTARDAGDNCILNQSCSTDNLSFNLTTDQRGLTRPQGSTVDIGALEVLSIPNTPDLLPASDSGSSQTDNITNATNLQFQVTGADAGTTVELLRDGTVAATATADSGGTATLSYTDSSPDGIYNFTSRLNVSGAFSAQSAPLGVTIDRTRRSVTIDQAGGQSDPTNTLPINFSIIFNEPVADFTNAGVSLAGSTANVSSATITVTGSGANYNVAVSNVSTDGMVQASIPQNVTFDTAGNGNTASTSTDNSVTYDTTPPTVTINQAVGQSDPTSSLPINFTVVFSEPVTGFTNTDISLAGSTANVSSATITVTGSGASYNVAVNNVTGSGIVQVAIPAGAANDLAGNASAASTSTDRTVTYNLPPPDVTINQAVGQADPTNTLPINFTVVFNEPVTGFTNSDVSLSGSTANVSSATINVTGSGANYNVAVSNVSTDGTVQASIPANSAINVENKPNNASTSTDNTVTRDTAQPTVTINQAAGQSDPTSTQPINFTASFNEPVTGFTNTDISLAGSTANIATATINVTPVSSTTYSVSVSNISSGGTVQASVPAGAAFDLAGNSSLASTSTDNTVTFNPPPTNLVINLLGDSGDGVCDATCTLRDAIITSNNTSGIKNLSFNLPACLPASPCTITLTQGEMTLNNNGPVGIAGPGANVLSVSGNNQGRIFVINSGAGFSLSNLKMTGGRAFDGYPGGDGGALYNNGGTVTLTNVTLSGNSAGNGGPGNDTSNSSPPGNGGNGGNGGAIYNAGTLTLNNTTVSGNNAGGGGTGGWHFCCPGGDGGAAGNGGNGGAIYNTGTLTLINSSIISNSAGAGNVGGLGTNTAGFAFIGTGGSGGAGGQGGGLYSTGTMNIINDTFSNNSSGAGGKGGDSFGFGGFGGAGGQGGAIYINGGTLGLTNSTLSGNSNGNGGVGGNSAGGGSFTGGNGGNGGQGGGIFSNGGTLNLANNTITNNNVGSGGAGGGSVNVGNAPSGSAGTGGGIRNASGTVNLKNSIIARNSISASVAGPDVSGAFTSQGRNFIGKNNDSTGLTDDPGCSGLCDKVGTSASPKDPLLSPMQDNGGPTLTHMLLDGSLALNTGGNTLLPPDTFDLNGNNNTSETLPVDERGVSRIFNATVDIGAIERQSTQSLSTSTGATALQFTSINLRFSNVTQAGTTSVEQIASAAAGTLPAGYTLCPSCPAFNIFTTSTYTGSINLCFNLPSISDPNTFNHLKVLHRENGVLLDRTTAQNFNARIICGSVSSLSPFIITQGAAPTAAPASISGRVTTTDGAPLGGVVVNLDGDARAQTITDGYGQYSFDGVEANGFFVVTPQLANYSFSPQARAFQLLANRTDALFIAIPDATPTTNPLDTDLYFVRQQYLDFLGREPDASGLAYWSGELGRCGADQSCLNQRRIDISAAFFMSDEFQQTDSFVYRLYKAGVGRKLSYQEFLAYRQQVSAGGNLELTKAAFAEAFVERAEFMRKYGSATSAVDFVDALIRTIQQVSGVDLSSQRSALISQYNSGATLNESRSLTLRAAIESDSFKRAEYNPLFVLMQYFGYLRRDPDQGGYDFWLEVLNNRGAGNYRSMVCAFLTSAEYQRRFSTVVTHSNSECGQ